MSLMRRLLLPLALSAGLLSPAALAAGPVAAPAVAKARAAGPVAGEAWIAEAPPGAPHNAAYLVLRNGPRADVLVAVESPVCEVAELHSMQKEKGLLRMRHEPRLVLAPGATVVMAPGGHHIMLINMKRSLALGEKVPLTLRFEKAGAVTVQAEVRARPLDDEAGHGHHGHHGHQGHQGHQGHHGH